MDSIRRTAKGLKGFPRRVFQAVVTKEYAEGKGVKLTRKAFAKLATRLQRTADSLKPVSTVAPNASVLSHAHCASQDRQSGCTFLLAGCLNGVAGEFYHPPRPLRPRDQQVWVNIYPNHTGAVCNAVFGDGSVRGISNNIDIGTWSAFVTPGSGEVASSD